MAITRPRVSTCSCCSEFRLSSVIASVLVDGPICILLCLSYVIDSVQATVQGICLSITTKGLREVLVVIQLVTAWTKSMISDEISKGSSWTVEVQRLLQPTRELVKSGYEARVESQGSVITR